MIPSYLLEKIRYLELKTARLARGALAGEYASAFKGTGIEFEKVREYIPGDDVRAIDWNVTARMNAPFIKVYREERELTLMVILDISGSLGFGTGQKSKKETACELATLLSLLGTKNQDRVGLLLFSDRLEAYIPAKKGRAHIWQIIRTILTHTPQGKGTDLSLPCELLLQRLKRQSLCFFISDFSTQECPPILSRLAHRHEVTCIQVVDPGERNLPNSRGGVFVFQDMEEDRTVRVHTGQIRAQFAQKRALWEKQWGTFFKKNQIPFFSVSTQEELIYPLMAYLKKRHS
jgi:uncharacterized protein (DUF58 family)